MNKLNQILAIEKGIKTRVYREFTDLHQATQKADLMNGFSKTFQPLKDGDEVFPPESKKVQFNHTEVLVQVGALLAELFDVTAAKDWANTSARADVVIEGRTLIKDVPAPYLLFLEKQLSDLSTFVAKMAELDSADDWMPDPATGLHKTSPSQTHRTKKVQRALVLYPATEQHPAQTQLITEDVVSGHWTTVKLSGAIPAPKKREILARIERLSGAVKFAREQANAVEAPERKFGQEVLAYIFGK
jgi:hypothetical protein